MVDDLWWRDADAEYIRRRSDRYPGAVNIEPGLDMGSGDGSSPD